MEVGALEVTARVSLGKLDGEGYGLACELEVAMPGAPREVAESMVDKARRNCPYSKATRANVDTRVTIARHG